MTIIPANQLFLELQQFVNDVHWPRDSSYFCPKRDNLQPFLDWMARYRQPYVKNQRDCDKLALRCSLDAAEGLSGTGVESGVAVIYAELVINNGVTLLGIVGTGKHAHNLVRCSDGTWLSLEPQNGLYEETQAVVDRFGYKYDFALP